MIYAKYYTDTEGVHNSPNSDLPLDGGTLMSEVRKLVEARGKAGSFSSYEICQVKAGKHSVVVPLTQIT